MGMVNIRGLYIVYIIDISNIKVIQLYWMKRNVLQVPIRIELREKAEKEAKDMGFSSLQEMVRVMLAQMVKKEIEPEFKIDDLCDKYGINYLGMFGSVARGEARKGSDIDLLVRLKRKLNRNLK